MPNIKSAKKRVNVIEAKTKVNNAKKSELKTAIKKANTAIAENAENASQSVNNAVKLIDQAAVSNIIHKNNAARKKSSLQKKLSSISAE